MLKKVLVISLYVVFIAAACGSVSAGELPKFDISICGGSIGGAWAAIGEGVGEVIRRSYPGSNTAYEVGQEAANVVLVSTGRVKLGVGHSQTLKLAMDGIEAFTGRKMENLRGICVLYGDAVEQFFVKSDTGITSFEDIKNKKYPLKVNFNTKDSFMELIGKKTLEAYGVTYENLIEWGGSVDFMAMNPSLDLMRDGRLEAYMNLIQIPSSQVVDLATNMKLTMLPVSKEVQDKINSEYGTYSSVIPKDAYSFLTEDVPTVAASLILFASDELPDEEAYAVVKSVYDNFDYFKSIHSSLQDLSFEDLSNTFPAPLHPGAKKFYDEHK